MNSITKIINLNNFDCNNVHFNNKYLRWKFNIKLKVYYSMYCNTESIMILLNNDLINKLKFENPKYIKEVL